MNNYWIFLVKNGLIMTTPTIIAIVLTFAWLVLVYDHGFFKSKGGLFL